MRAVSFAEYGAPSALRVVEADIPEPAPDQVRVKVRAAGVNPIDAKLRSGEMAEVMPLSLPHVLGSEVAGVVDAVGAGVTGVAVGDAVVGWSATGGYAEYALLSVYAPKPEGLDWAEAAALPVPGEAALRCLRVLDPKEGETLLVNGASGSVGSVATQIALGQGITVVGVAGERNQERVRALGAVATTYEDGLVERVRELAPQGVDAVLDSAGNGTLPALVALRGGVDRVVTVADSAAFDLGVPFLSGGADDQTPQVLATLLEAAAEGRIRLPVVRRFGLDEAEDAHLAQGLGKAVLEP
ncbi:NADP-dependent oxidoreductase [Nocardiopsis oceani]